MPTYPIPVADGSPFPLQNIPSGIFSERTTPTPRAATVIGEWVLDLALVESRGVFEQVVPASSKVFSRVRCPGASTAW